MPTRLERQALLASLSSVGAATAAASVQATLRQMLARHRFSYRHLLCEAVPALRPLLPLPEPLGPGLRLPVRKAAPEASQPRLTPMLRSDGTSISSQPP